MKTKKNGIVSVLTALVLAAILYSAEQMFENGGLLLQGKQKEYQAMMAEILVLLVFFLVLFKKVKQSGRAIFTVVITVVLFSWLHMVLVPLLVSGLYMGYLCLAGRSIRLRFLYNEKEEAVFTDFILGCGAVITLFCLMSAIGMGSIPKLQLAVGLHGFILLAVQLPKLQPKHVQFVSFPKIGHLEGCCLAFLICMVLLQVGKLNVAIDFDSLWYGVRSRYMLDGQHGIYENMGTIGVVYTYSKGFEVLTLPLANLPSYSFLTGFNIWSSVLILWSTFRIALRYMSRNYAWIAMTLLSMVPGIMNMGLTAKSDSVTLLLQLIMILFILCYLEKEKMVYLLISLSAFFLSWTMKPTALIFSTAVLGMSGIHLLAAKKIRWNLSVRQLLVLVSSLTSWIGIWTRTFLIVGVPITSVFSSIFVKLGFQLNYPFCVTQIPNESSGLGFLELLVHFLKRLYGFLLAPTGEMMDHVILAWGGLLIAFFLLLGCASCFFPRQEIPGEKVMLTYGKTVFFPFLIVNLISLLMLSQVDGNYFMLLYVMVILMGCGILSHIKEGALRKWLTGLLIPIAIYQIAIVSLTSWSWTAHFSEMHVLHKGYFDHQAAAYQQMSESGNQRIWDVLSKDPNHRLISVGDHPQSLQFPCNAQSYADITGSWGNVVLVKTMDNFIEFMDYAKTDYVYLQAEYMEEGTRCYELMRYLIENGTLTDLIYEDGNALAQVMIQGKPSDAATRALHTFDENYRRKK